MKDWLSVIGLFAVRGGRALRDLTDCDPEALAIQLFFLRVGHGPLILQGAGPHGPDDLAGAPPVVFQTSLPKF